MVNLIVPSSFMMAKLSSPNYEISLTKELITFLLIIGVTKISVSTQTDPAVVVS